jgi:hypothetical protein
MHRYLLVPILGTLLFASCVASVGPHGTQVAIAPPLPVVVELGSPYYVYSGYHYYYHGKRWYYAPSRGARWVALPRGHYPREVRYRTDYRDRYRSYDRYRDDRRYHGDDRYRRGDHDDRWDD